MCFTGMGIAVRGLSEAEEKGETQDGRHRFLCSSGSALPSQPCLGRKVVTASCDIVCLGLNNLFVE